MIGLFGGSIRSEIEVFSRHSTGIIPRQTNFANVRPHAVDRACGRDADGSFKRCTAIAVTSHASSIMIDVNARDSPEIGVTF